MWDCPECGIENFCRSIVSDDPEEVEELQEYEGIYDVGVWHTAPETVVCKACGTKYDTNYDVEWED